jgi:signal transduction histidine kinase/CheY-like chemotaxis protein
LTDFTASPSANSLPPFTGDEPAAILLIDENGRVTGANRAAHALCDSAGRELVGARMHEIFSVTAAGRASPESDNEDYWPAIVRLAAGQEVAFIARRRTSTTTRAFSSGDLRITVEKMPREAWMATLQPAPAKSHGAGISTADLAVLGQQSAAGFFALNLPSGEAMFSARLKSMLGAADHTMAETVETWRALIHPEDSDAAPDRLEPTSAAATQSFDVEFRLRHQAGRWLWVQATGVIFIGADNRPERVVGLLMDVSERKAVEESTLLNDGRLQLVGGSGLLGLFDLDFERATHWFSPGWRALLGYAENEGAHDLEMFARALPADEQSAGVETWIRLRSPHQAVCISSETLVDRNGEPVPVLLGMHLSLSRKRELTRVTGFICPAPSAGGNGLSAALFQEAFATLNQGVLASDGTGKIRYANPTACRLLGLTPEFLEDAFCSQVFKLVKREAGQAVDDPVARAFSVTEPLPLITDEALAPAAEGGTPRPIAWTARTSRDVNGRPQGLVILFRDPADAALTPEEMIKTNRLESLGTVAGGIAHDFNDLLTTILAGVSLAKDHQDFTGLEDSEKACLTAKSLTKHLLGFAKGGTSAFAEIAPEDILRSSLRLAAAGSAAEITVEVAEGTESVRVDRAQMIQVFQNLILNALQAMPGPPHVARILLRAGNVTLAADQIPPLAAGHYVELEVRDNGSGIAPENLEKIFAPFFTTHRHGTGLGLATALSIVRRHDGQIGVVSELGAGAAFTVFLPAANAPAPLDSRAAPFARFQTGRILVMDDDPRITSLTTSMLHSLDYKFDVARNGEEAVQLYQRYLAIGRPYDAVILDVTVVGGMGGEQCFKALLQLDPGVRAIISTGYENDAMNQRFIDEGFCGCLTKPYRVADLGKVLKNILG